MPSVFVGAAAKYRDKNGKPNKMFFGYSEPPNDFTYMSISCTEGLLVFSEFGIQLEPLAWSVVISGQFGLRDVRFFIRQQKNLHTDLPCTNTGGKGNVFDLKLNPLTTSLWFLRLSGYIVDPESDLGKLEQTNQTQFMRPTPYLDSLLKFSTSLDSKVTEQMLTDALQSQVQDIKQDFNVEYKSGNALQIAASTTLLGEPAPQLAMMAEGYTCQFPNTVVYGLGGGSENHGVSIEDDRKRFLRTPLRWFRGGSRAHRQRSLALGALAVAGLGAAALAQSLRNNPDTTHSQAAQCPHCRST